MTSPPSETRSLRLAVRWRALEELDSHVDLIRRTAEHLDAEVLVLDSGGGNSPLSLPKNWRVGPVGTAFAFHPAITRLRGWKVHLKSFSPHAVLALDEPYCLSTFQLTRWAAAREIPAVFLSCQNIDRPLPFPFSLIESKTLAACRGGWFLNEEARDRAQRRGFRGEGEVFPLGVNPKDFPLLDSPGDSARRDLDPKQNLLVGYAGRLVPEKGLDTLIDACARTGDSLLVAGEGPEREALQRQAERAGVMVEWLGAIPSDRMGEVYARMDVLVLPSLETPRWKEQFGRVLVEAMAAGAPVVGARSGEIPRVISDAGLVFTPGDDEDLAGCLRRLRSEASLRRDLVARGLQRVRMNYTNPVIAENLARWLSRVIGVERPTGAE